MGAHSDLGAKLALNQLSVDIMFKTCGSLVLQRKSIANMTQEAREYGKHTIEVYIKGAFADGGIQFNAFLHERK